MTSHEQDWKPQTLLLSIAKLYQIRRRHQCSINTRQLCISPSMNK